MELYNWNCILFCLGIVIEIWREIVKRGIGRIGILLRECGEWLEKIVSIFLHVGTIQVSYFIYFNVIFKKFFYFILELFKCYVLCTKDFD